MKRKHVQDLVVTLGLALALGACGDDGGTGPESLPSLEGTWAATTFRMEPVGAAGTGSFDPIAAGGSLRLDIRADGEVVTTTVDPGSAPDVDTGHVRVLSETRLELRMRAADQVLTLDYSLRGDRLELSGQASVDVEGYKGQAALTAAFVRVSM